MHALTRTLSLLWSTALLTGASCSTPQRSASPDTSDAAAVITGDTSPAGQRARIEKLEAEARAIAKVAGCASATGCRTASVGARACGGPRTYIVYCAASTDSVALFRKLAELETVEKAYLKSSGMVGTCEFRMPPGVTASGGSCRETAGVP